MFKAFAYAILRQRHICGLLVKGQSKTNITQE